jgi:hypothetical protein
VRRHVTALLLVITLAFALLAVAAFSPPIH